jgi:hypothetical protein
MLDLHVINHPIHYVQGRSIEPIEVIENWALCHHLACAVKYLARAGRKNSTLEDLKKAEWYLERELTRYQQKFNKCQLALKESTSIPVSSILEDWELSPNLEQALVSIKAAKSHSLREVELSQALKSIRKEIEQHESIR